MKAYVIATIKNKDKIIGYFLTDTDSNNNVICVKRDALLFALENNKIKIENAKLNNGKIQGIAYSLESLSYIEDNKVINKGFLVIAKDNKGIYLISSFPNAKSKLPVVVKATKNNIQGLIKKNVIINIDEQLKTIDGIKINGSSNSVVSTKAVSAYAPASNNSVEQVNETPVKEEVKGVIKEKEVADINNNKQEQIIDEQLEKEARDPSVEWSEHQFRKYMTMHNWSFKAGYMNSTECTAFTVCDIDPRCTVIHLPVETVIVESLFSSMPRNEIEVLIINKKLRYFNSFVQKESLNDTIKDELQAGKRLYKIKSLYFQSGLEPDIEKASVDGSIELDGIRNCEIANVVSLPRNDRIFDLCNYCDIQGIVLPSISNNICRTVISRCFLYCNIKNTAEFKKINIVNCFNYTEMPSVKIGEQVIRIEASFRNDKLQPGSFSMDLSEAVDLYDLDIRDNSGIEELDLRNCESLHSLQSTRGLYSLKTVYFPNVAERDRPLSCNKNGLFRESKITELTIYKGMTDIGFPIGDNATIIFDKSISKITNEYLNGFRGNSAGNKLVFLADQLDIEREAFNTIYYDVKHKISLSDFSIDPNKIMHVRPLGFSKLYFDMFDTEDFPNITSIKNMGLAGMSANTIIINDNIEEIGECFLGANDKYNNNCVINLHSLIISDKCKFNHNAFYRFRSNTVINAYVVKGSTAHKMLSTKKKQFNIILVKDVAEAKEMIESQGGKGNEAKLGKLKILGGADDRVFINCADNQDGYFAYTLYNNLLRGVLPQEIPLNETKFIDLDICGYASFDKNLCGINIDDVCEDTRRFNAICNLMTAKLNVDTMLTDPVFIDKIKYFDSKVVGVSYIDNRRFAGTIRITVNTNDCWTDREMSGFIYLFVIVIDKRIKFISQVSSSFSTSFRMYRDSFKAMEWQYSYNSYNRDLQKITHSFSHLLTSGDLIFSSQYNYLTSLVINGKNIPVLDSSNSKYKDVCDLASIFHKSVVVIGYDPDKYLNSIALNYVFYDLVSQKIIYATLKSNSKINYLNENSASLFVNSVVDIEEFFSDKCKIPNKYYFMLNRYFEQSAQSKFIIKCLTFSKEKISAIKNSPSSYDVDNIMVSDRASEIYTKSLMIKSDNAEQFSIKTICDLLGESGFYKKDQISHKKLVENKDYAFVKTYSFGEYFIQEYAITATKTNLPVSEHRMLYLCKANQSESRKQPVFIGSLGLEQVIKLFIEIGKNIKTNSLSPVKRIDLSKAYPESQFKLLHGTRLINSVNSNFLKAQVAVAIDRADGEAYITAHDECTGKMIPLMRFNTLLDAEYTFNNFYNRSVNITLANVNTLYSDGLFINALIKNTVYNEYMDQEKTSRLYKITQIICDGLPNGLPYSMDGSLKVFIDKMAKQHKDPI